MHDPRGFSIRSFCRLGISQFESKQVGNRNSLLPKSRTLFYRLIAAKSDTGIAFLMPLAWFSVRIRHTHRFWSGGNTKRTESVGNYLRRARNSPKSSELQGRGNLAPTKESFVTRRLFAIVPKRVDVHPDEDSRNGVAHNLSNVSMPWRNQVLRKKLGFCPWLRDSLSSNSLNGKTRNTTDVFIIGTRILVRSYTRATVRNSQATPIL